MLFLIVLATYMVPSQAILIPQFILYRRYRFVRQPLGLILLGSFSVLGTFMLRQFFMGVHQEFIESAKIDGADHVRIFCDIALPLVKPAVATYAILRFIWTWNDYQRSADLSAQRQAVHDSARDAEIHLDERRILLADHGGRRLGDTAAPDRVHHRTEERHRWHCSRRRQRVMKAWQRSRIRFKKVKIVSSFGI